MPKSHLWLNGFYPSSDWRGVDTKTPRILKKREKIDDSLPFIVLIFGVRNARSDQNLKNPDSWKIPFLPDLQFFSPLVVNTMKTKNSQFRGPQIGP